MLTRRSGPRISTAVLLGCALFSARCGCSSAPTTVTVVVLSGAGDDPFTNVARARLRVNSTPPVVFGPVEFTGASTFAAVLDAASSVPVQIVFEGLASGDAVVAIGATPTIDLSLYGGEAIGILVQRPASLVQTPARMQHARAHAAVAPIAQTWVFLAGGEDSLGPVATSETYDLLSHTFVTGSPDLPGPRSNLGAFAVDDYRVALFGGRPAQNDTLLIDLGRLRTTSNPLAAPTVWLDPVVARLPSGDPLAPWGGALVFGGTDGSLAGQTETFRIAGGALSSGALAALDALSTARDHPTATLTTDGTILIYGGIASGDPPALLYDDTASPGGLFAVLAGATPDSRTEHAAALLGDGRVLIVGGRDATGGLLLDSLVVDPGCARTGCLPTQSVGPLLRTPRRGHTLTGLGNDRLLVAGGYDAAGLPLDTVEVVDGANLRVDYTLTMRTARAGHVAIALPTGQALIAGGLDASGPLDTGELFQP